MILEDDNMDDKIDDNIKGKTKTKFFVPFVAQKQANL